METVPDFNPNISVPWPQPGDVLFKTDDDWWHTATLSSGHKHWWVFAEGYKRAADNLADQLNGNSEGINFLVYPIAFLYRHCLELQLKDLIVMGQELLNKPPDLKHVHRLDVLWQICREIFVEIWPNGSAEDLDAVQNCILELCRTDPLSMSFRYPITKDGNATLSGIERVSIRNLREVTERIFSLLEAARMGISVYLDDKWQIDSYYGNGW